MEEGGGKIKLKSQKRTDKTSIAHPVVDELIQLLHTGHIVLGRILAALATVRIAHL